MNFKKFKSYCGFCMADSDMEKRFDDPTYRPECARNKKGQFCMTDPLPICNEKNCPAMKGEKDDSNNSTNWWRKIGNVSQELYFWWVGKNAYWIGKNCKYAPQIGDIY